MRLFPSQYDLEKALTDITREAGPHLGLVSADVPLISNLDVWQNIALVCQCRQHRANKNVNSLVDQGLQRFGLEGIATKRNPSLSEEERFLVMLLRAAMVPEAVIVIDRLFRIIHCLADDSFVQKKLEKIEDMFTKCYIMDYSHNKNICEMTDAADGS